MPRSTGGDATGHAAEIEREYDRLMAATASIIERLADPTLDVVADKKLFDDAVLATVAWTRLADDGHFLEVSRPYSQAFAKIIFGMEAKRADDVHAGADEIIHLARRIT